MSKVLVLEDNATIARGIRHNLELEGLDVVTIGDGMRGLRYVRDHPVDLLILDLMLPTLDGFQVLRELRGLGVTAPVLILSARGMEMDKIRGFRLGADDYVVKPFGLKELLARVEALLKRARGVTPGVHEGSKSLRVGELEIRRGERRVLRRGIPIELRPREYDLLMALVDRRGDAVSRATLLQEVWGYADDVTTRTVDAHVAALRQRLEADPRRPARIVTVRKIGYRFQF